MPQYPTTVEKYFKQIYYNAIDCIVSTIRERFNQDGFQKYVLLENLLHSYLEELQSVCNFYKDDLNKGLLDTQLRILQTIKPEDQRSITSFKDVWKFFQKMSKGQRTLFSEVIKVLKLILVMPATNASSERSFSALRRIKTYLRNTMSQARLNHIM